jgi:acylphosphatase
MSEDLACLHAIIHGRVQGVGFRATVQDWAQSLKLTGWVRNKGEDQVEVWAEGPRPDLEKLLALLNRGPRMAVVDSVQATWPEPESKLTRFSVVSSAW